MKLGVCTTPDRILLVRELGFDYIEPSLSWLVSLDEATYRAHTALVERHGLPAEACNGFFPRDMILYPQGDTPAEADGILREIAAYVERGCSRAARWGAQVAVLGSGTARRVPDGDAPRETRLAAAESHFARMLAVCGDVAERHGMRVAVEPLSRSETNFIHTVREGDRVARLSGHSSVGVMVDLFHAWSNGDDLAALSTVGDRLLHAHIARPAPDRHAPTEADDETVTAWAAILRTCPSVERLSLECIFSPDLETALRHSVGVMSRFR